MSGIRLAAVLLTVAASPASAQMRSLVVPGDSTVVIAPRGEPAPRVRLAPAPRAQQQRMVMVSPGGETLAGPTAFAAAGIAAAAAAAALFAGAGSGGSNGGASATASTAATRR